MEYTSTGRGWHVVRARRLRNTSGRGHVARRALSQSLQHSERASAVLGFSQA